MKDNIIQELNSEIGNKLLLWNSSLNSNEFSENNEVDSSFEEYTKNTIDEFEENMEDLYISNALGSIWKIISRTNKYIDETAPWVLAKEENKEKLKSTMYHLVENLRKIAILLTPFMPQTSEKIFSQLGLTDENLKTWDSLKQNNTISKSKKVTEQGEPLFMRKDRQEEIEYIQNLMKK